MAWGIAVDCHAQIRPNIILINVDDLDVELYEDGITTQVFPNLQRLAGEGVRFTNCHVTSPLCGPSRASLLTGRYVHQHGVRVQDPEQRIANGFPGGFGHFHSQVTSQPPAQNKPDWTQQDIGVAMKAAGYRTMLVGKYLHSGFEPAAGQSWRDIHPIGWDDFYCSLGGHYYDVLQYLGRRGIQPRDELRNTADIRLTEYPDQELPFLYSRYRTNIETMDAWHLVSEQQEKSPLQPFFLYWAPFAPHRAGQGSMVDARYQNWWPQLKQPHRQDFDFPANSSKPEVLRRLEELSLQKIQESDLEYRERLLAMKSLDGMLGFLLDRLKENKLLGRTVIIFTSDNGYMLGQQRHFGKQLPYDRCTRVPFVVWGPNLGIARNQQRDHLISHVDLYPTLVHLAGSTPDVPLDGLPINGLFTEGVTPPEASSWRPDGVLCEHFQRLGHAWQDIEGVFQSLRFYNHRYTHWGDGLSEYYELNDDRWELDNRYEDLDSGDRNLFQLLMESAIAEQDYVLSIANPFVDQDIIFRGASMSGYASSPLGVREVRLVFRRLNANGEVEYLNGEDWTTTYAQNRAELADRENSLTRWNFEFRPQGSGSYPVTMTVRIYNRAGGFQPTVTTRFLTVEHDTPATQITSHVVPRMTIPPGQDLELAGWAKGELGIREVRIVIRDTATNRYFDGTEWRTGYRHVAAGLTTPNGDDTYRLWTLTLPRAVLTDRMYVSARSYQVDGQYDQTVPWTILEKP